MTSVFRFAPSPNGALHLGHALSALIGYEQARRAGGRFLLRIEDIDTARCREAFITGIYDDLAWLGLTWEQPVLRQSQHFQTYQAMAVRLLEMGLLYPCFATRTEIEAAAASNPGADDPDGAPLYPGLHKHLSTAEVTDRKAAGQPFALRINIERAIGTFRTMSNGIALTWRNLDPETGRITDHIATPEIWGDAIITRKEVPASYHIAVVTDDARQGVTHVTRGTDLFATTHLHRLLQALLGLPEPIYCHHRLLTDQAGRKLAKSAQDISLQSLRDAGATPEDVRRLAKLA